MVFNGWLVLTSRPGLSCSPAHTRSHVKPNAHRHPPTDSCSHTHTHAHTHACAHTHTHTHTLPFSLHPSSGGFWQLFMLLNWLSHYSWNTSRLREKESSRFLREGKESVRGKTRAERRRNMLKCRRTALISIIRQLSLFWNQKTTQNLIFWGSLQPHLLVLWQQVSHTESQNWLFSRWAASFCRRTLFMSAFM